MFSHEPAGYACDFCALIRGEDTGWNVQSDVVYRNDETTAFVNAAWWPRNEGHVLVVPNRHIENIYVLPKEVAAEVHDTARLVAIALKETYGCDGTSTRQHNEPGGNQEVWHYHMHVFPRYEGDGLYGARRRITTAAERLPYADRLRAWFAAG